MRLYPQGEDQKKLDVLANEVFINLLSKCGQCAVLVRDQGCYCGLLLLSSSYAPRLNTCKVPHAPGV